MITMRDLLGAKALTVERTCPTGKAPYPTKAAARTHLRRMHGHRTVMRAFRCGFCNQYHVGHRRGAVL